MGRQGSRLYVRGAETQAKGKDVGTALRLEKGRARSQGRLETREPFTCPALQHAGRGADLREDFPVRRAQGHCHRGDEEGSVGHPQRDRQTPLSPSWPQSCWGQGEGQDDLWMPLLPGQQCVSSGKHRKEGSVSMLGTSVAMHCSGCDFPNLRDGSAGPRLRLPPTLQALDISLTVAQGGAKDPLGADEERSLGL